jgi:cbb3-type cytochrome oxidase maturation protein
MDVMFLILPLSMLIAAGALRLFVWAVRSGQFDDLETPAVRAMLDDVEGERARDRSSARPSN